MNNNSNMSLNPKGNTSDGAKLNDTVIPSIVQLVLYSLTILLALAYAALIIIRPIFRQNKLNWFIVNICLQSAAFCVFILPLTCERVFNISSPLPCRIQAYLIIMSICQVLYSHCVASICRLLALIYATKHLFRSSVFTWICMGSGWLVSILVPSPYILFDGFGCSIATQAEFLPYYTISMCLALPMVIVAACNSSILWFVRHSTRQVHAEAAKNKGSHGRDIQLMKTLIGTFMILVIGWTPTFIFQTLLQNLILPIDLSICIETLPSVSMLLDVILLIYTNQPVRLYLKQRILRRAAPGNPPHTNRN